MPSKEFLQELKDSFNSVMQSKEHIEARASNIVTVSGTVAALLFGFGTYLLSNIASDYYLRNYIFYVLAFGILAALISLLSGVLVAYRRTKYRFPMTYEAFYKDGKLDPAVVDQFKQASQQDFSDRMIEEYLEAIKKNTERNADKAFKLQFSQWSLFVTILFIMVLVIFLGMTMHDGKIVIKPLTGG